MSCFKGNPKAVWAGVVITMAFLLSDQWPPCKNLVRVREGKSVRLAPKREPLPTVCLSRVLIQPRSALCYTFDSITIGTGCRPLWPQGRKLFSGGRERKGLHTLWPGMPRGKQLSQELRGR